MILGKCNHDAFTHDGLELEQLVLGAGSSDEAGVQLPLSPQQAQLAAVELMEMQAYAGERLPLPAKNRLKNQMMGLMNPISSVPDTGRRQLGQLACSIDMAKDFARLVVERRARGGERDAALRTREQTNSTSLRALEVRAERGLNDVEALSGPTEVHLLGNGDEVAKMAELHHSSGSITSTCFMTR